MSAAVVKNRLFFVMASRKTRMIAAIVIALLLMLCQVKNASLTDC